jgi:hypothetical protein
MQRKTNTSCPPTPRHFSSSDESPCLASGIHFIHCSPFWVPRRLAPKAIAMSSCGMGTVDQSLPATLLMDLSGEASISDTLRAIHTSLSKQQPTEGLIWCSGRLSPSIHAQPCALIKLTQGALAMDRAHPKCRGQTWCISIS